MKLLTVVLAAGLALALTGLAKGAAGKPRQPRAEFFGIVPQDDLERGEYATVRASGAGSIRYSFNWAAIEPFPGAYNWSGPDGTVAAAAAAGVRVLPVLYGLPPWIRLLDGGRSCGGPCSAVAPRSRDAREAFASFAAEAARRYGPAGSFWGPSSPAVPIRSWQIWNEPNSADYYAPEPDPEGYAELLAATAAAIRAVDPEAEIVLGGMWGPASARAVVPVPRYLERLYAVSGVEASFETVGVHPYGPQVGSLKRQIRAVLRATRRAGDAAVRLSVTEVGWASHGPPSDPLVKGARGQARLLRRAFAVLLRNRRTWRLDGVFWFSWRDSQRASCAWCPGSGLRRLDGRPKPAFRAFAEVARP